MEKERDRVFQADPADEARKKLQQKTAQKIITMGWGCFFIWLGIFLWVHFQTGYFLLGLGVLILGMQFARRHYDLPVQHFWIAASIVAIIGGAWDLIETELPLVPVLLILAGSGMVLIAIWGKRDLTRR